MEKVNVAISRKDIEAECKLATSNPDKERDVERYSCEYLERLALMRKIADHLPEHNCFLMHGAVISVQGDGYLFTAPSGTGKSTHVSLRHVSLRHSCKLTTCKLTRHWGQTPLNTDKENKPGLKVL